MPMPELDPYRLPTTVSPRRYDLELAPDLAAATFAGTVAIDVEVHEPVDEIVLNALELDIHEAWVEWPDGTRLDATVRLDEPTERAFLALPSAVPAGPAVVTTCTAAPSWLIASRNCAGSMVATCSGPTASNEPIIASSGR